MQFFNIFRIFFYHTLKFLFSKCYYLMLHLKKSKVANNNEKFEKMYVKIPLKEKQFLINHI